MSEQVKALDLNLSVTLIRLSSWW
ncbi:hypothetical protein [Yersinia rohdei]